MAWLKIIGNKGVKSLFGALASKGMSKMTILTSLVAILLFVGSSSLKAQIDYPVQANVVVLPPYSVYLTDYYAKGSQQLKVQLLLKEISRPSFQVKLRFKITGSALTLTSRDGVTLPPFTVQGGTTIETAGDQLAAYLSQNALVASGADANSFINNGQRMADGFYKIEVWAEEMLRSVRVSNVATTFISTALYQPPMITSPMDKSTIADMGMQNIAFQWLPRHMSASVDVVQSTYYKIRLVEIWPKERDAVEAIRNSNALYEGLTNSTMFVYGIDQPTLISGRRYALQIQAQTADQRDLFVNQGFSNIISFTYGQECVAPQGFNVAVEGPAIATASWSGNARNNSYNVQYRKVYGSDTTWHETVVAAPTYKLTNLVPKSSYQVKVSGNCGLAKSIYTPERTFTTSGIDTPFDCGKSSTIPTITNRTPKTSLAIGDEIHAADFDVKVVMWAQENGNQFTGVGLATIPFLRNAPAPCKFENIQVNSDNQLIGGTIVIGENIKLDDNTLREAGRLAGDVENALSGGANSQVTTTILTTTFKGSPVVTPIAQTYPTPATAKVTIATADGKTITAPTGSNSRYIDSEGNVVSVAQNGAVTTGKIDKNAFGKGASSSASASVASGSSFPLVTFSADPTKIKYGYDMPRTNSAFPDSYQSLGSRKIGWMSVATGATDVAQASIDFQQSGLKTSDIRFRTSEGEVVDATTDNPAQVTLKGYSSNATTPIMAVVSKTEKDTEKPYICGQLNSVGYDLNRLRLYLVPVNGATIDAAGVKTTLNNIYKQAAIEWDVEYSPKELSLTLTPEELAAVCANIDATALSNYSPGMLAALKKLDREPDANNYELFIINGTANGVKGFMPLNRSAGFIFTGNQSAAEVQQTIAHELGHGAFGLEHVGTAAGKTATDNLMDYTASTALDKPQWDLIHGEHRRLTWFQGEEEGESKEDDFIVFLKNSTKNLSEQTNLKLFSIVHADYCCDLEAKNGLIAREVFPEMKHFTNFSVKGVDRYYDLKRKLIFNVLYCEQPVSGETNILLTSIINNESDKVVTSYDIHELPFLGIFSEPSKVLYKRCSQFIPIINNWCDVKTIDDQKYWETIFKALDNCNKYKATYQDESKGKNDDKEILFNTINNLRTHYAKKQNFESDPDNLNLFLDKRIDIVGENIKIGNILYPYIRVVKISDNLQLNVQNIHVQASTENCRKIPQCINVDNKILLITDADKIDDLLKYIMQAKKGLTIFANGYDPMYGESIYGGLEFFQQKLADILREYPLNVPLTVELNVKAAITTYFSQNVLYNDICKRHQNDVLFYDFGNYWGEIDDLFNERIGEVTSVYADGSYPASTADNVAGFEERKSGGRIAGQDIVSKIEKNSIFVDKSTPIDVVAHSMGYAYALGIIETLQSKGYKIGMFYCIAPENPSAGYVPENIEGVWQYGSHEKRDNFYKQDLIAPQLPITGINTNRRLFIPKEEQDKWIIGNGWYFAHSIQGYGWIFDKSPKQDGYVKKR